MTAPTRTAAQLLDEEALHDVRVSARRLRSWHTVGATLPGPIVPARGRTRLPAYATVA